MRIPADLATRPVGHAHFWERAAAAGVTRGQFLRRSAATVGGLAGLTLFAPGTARAAANDPRPIPGGIQPFGPGTEVFHLFLPGPTEEQSSITDFNGFLGVTETVGTGTGHTGAGPAESFNFAADMRFMKGVYVGESGKHYHGAFAFV